MINLPTVYVLKCRVKESFAVSDTSIAVHITNLRQKIEIDSKNPQYIKTVE